MPTPMTTSGVAMLGGFGASVGSPVPPRRGPGPGAARGTGAAGRDWLVNRARASAEDMLERRITTAFGIRRSDWQSAQNAPPTTSEPPQTAHNRIPSPVRANWLPPYRSGLFSPVARIAGAGDGSGDD